MNKPDEFYRGYYIDFRTYKNISVFVEGDDYSFQTVADAKRFIDKLIEEAQ